MAFNKFTTLMVLSLCFGAVLVKAKAAAITDYCSLCQNHIGCENDGQFSSACSDDAKIVNMTPQLKELILDTHNRLRSEFAMGNTPGFEQASRMGFVQWDNELARLAELNGKRCFFGHDECRATDKFREAGQNIAMMFQNGGYPAPSNIKGLMQSWWDEYKKTDQSALNPYNLATLSQNGHFAAMARDRATRVGCAIANFFSNNLYNIYLVCNYAVTNLGDEPTYSTGPTGSECKTGTDKKYPGLCSPSEKYVFT